MKTPFQILGGRLILDTDLCQIIQGAKNPTYRMFVLGEDREWVELKEMPGDLKGLVTAVDLSVSILSGKFWVKGRFPEFASEKGRRLIEGRQ